MNLKVVIKNDQLVEDDMELFPLKHIKGKSLKQVEEVNVNDLDEEDKDSSDDEQAIGKKTWHHVSFNKDSGTQDWKDKGDSSIESSVNPVQQITFFQFFNFSELIQSRFGIAGP
jgi:hypothetical protein